ncbi:hypothetical protein B0H19DRAFT_65460 [Mycena capillaripes]|nr:hypothetical protein B0H19DRAFT_65460 [Mycena capillaripes]
MLHVHSICKEISPVQRPGLRKIGSHIKVWMKRDDVERKIGHLKEHVNKCYFQFTAFSAARIEQRAAHIEDVSLRGVNTTLRVEQTLIVNNVENQVKLRRMEGMMARVLLDTQFGQNVLDRTIEIIRSDSNHETLESQYLSVQNTHLLDSVRKLWTNGNLVLEPFWDTALTPVFVNTTSTLDVLYMILGFIRDLHNGGNIKTESTIDFMSLGVHLIELGMASDGIACHLLKIHILRPLVCSPGPLTWLASSLDDLSLGYRSQLQYEDALKASQQSSDLWCHVSESLPEIDNRIGLLTAIVIHAKNLLETGQKLDALSVAQDAVALSRPLAEQIIKSSSGLSSLTEEDEFKAVQARNALFILAKASASLDCHLNSYEASKEAFENILRLPVSNHPPSGKDIDSFLDQVCKVAEGGEFTLAMLANCVNLFRNLARMYPEETASQFLSLLHAHVYFSQQDNLPNMNSSMETLRVFLEPNSDCPPPKVDTTDFKANDGIIEDAVWAFYRLPWRSTVIHPLIQSIFVTDFEQAIPVLQEAVVTSCSDQYLDLSTTQWILYSTLDLDILPLLSRSDGVTMLRILTKTIAHLGPMIVHFLSNSYDALADAVTKPFSQQLWAVGLFDDALAVSNYRIQYLGSPSESNVTNNLGLCLLERAFILCDLGQVLEAIQVAQQTETMTLDPENDAGLFVHPYIIKTRILKRTGRNQEALQLLKKGVANGCRKYWTDDGQNFDIAFYLLVERAAAWGHVGKPKKALKHAERAVAACRKEVQDVEFQKCVLAHSLTTLANCLAAVRRNDNALVAAQEAVSIYTQNAAHMWGHFLYTIRKQELGANTFHSLSLRLATIGEPAQALINAERATELYRELVGLAPRHLPTLASSLRNIASLLWKVGRRDEAVTVCKEAVDILRKVVDPETYFLSALAEALDELAGYFTEKGDDHNASAVTAESAEVREKFASLPPQPEFLFEKVEVDAGSDDEEHKDAEECWETASEDDEYHDASELDAATDVEEVVSEAARAIISETPSNSTPAPTPDRPATDESHGIRATAEHTVISTTERVSDALIFPVDETVTSSIPARHEGPTTEAAISGKSPLTEILSTPLEVRLHSTPMDILWWVLLMLLGVSFAVQWSRVQ